MADAAVAPALRVRVAAVSGGLNDAARGSIDAGGGAWGRLAGWTTVEHTLASDVQPGGNGVVSSGALRHV